MAAAVIGRVRHLRWFGDPPRFREIQLDEDGKPKRDARNFTIPTGRVIKGEAARKLIHDLNRVRREIPAVDGGTIEVRGSLPPHWEIDPEWEWGYREQRGYQVPGRVKKIPYKGRHRALFGNAERAVLVADTVDLRCVTWWKQMYPDIPWRKLTRDYYWYKWDGYVTEVLAEDAEIILLACVGEFLDVTDNQDADIRLAADLLLVPA